MPIAPNQFALKRRLDRYLWANRSGEMEVLQAALDSNFRTFDRVAVIGGLVRDFAREGRAGFRSDVDLVIDDSREKVALLAEKLGATPNRFGGYGYKSGPWKIDFWALETTWARKHVPMRKLEDVLLGTFFDWDAIAYDLWERKLICSDDYLERIRAKRLDINLQPNPSPMGNLVRAIRRLVLWQASPGERLRCFIDEHLDESTLRHVQEKEMELFPYWVSTRWKTVEEAKCCLFQQRKLEILQFELFNIKRRGT
ncbi:hypothetical protein AAER22_29790 [Pseudomonas aeruginosa]|uniref:hypothetical protein n=2 Tax=Gammaproteobacteria TaxID=1236 RepID=UPI000F84BB04|nr:hypothetical protein [Pseudomonas aeruginosa]MBH3983072.1 hypothetical protein [Pseudomonas aeruginosa]MBH3989258.1 hypothetical protein [Pseudomonas aeruginosa]MBH4339914.1 hypothetical protein [Pseudomonas aeruginosa]MBH4426325.1 hypothetical protein [Pseudomonas aeruginosa]MBH8371206.1 hypothetical protein [Pseudomonas aeruginosa]